MCHLASSRCQNKLHRILDAGALLLFLGAALLTPVVTYYLSEHFLQGDLSSDLICANHLYETGQLLAKDWYGSTELRILRSEWIFMPLFALFDDWHMVRFAGTMILQIMIVLSFLCLTRRMHVRKSGFFLGAALLLLPYNFAYGVNVLYGCFYATFLSIIFLSTSLILALFESRSAFYTFLCCAALTILGFSASLGGPRILLNAAAPIFLAAALMLGKTRLAQRSLYAPGAGAGLFLFSSLCGYIINSKVLFEQYRFLDYPRRIQFNLFEQMDRMLTAIMHTFGFQTGPLLISKVGLLALCGALIAAVYFLYLFISFRRYIQGDHKTENSAHSDFIRLLAFFSLFTMVAFKVLTTDLNSNETYYLLVTIWLIPCLALEFSHSTLFRRLCSMMICLALCVNGAYSVGSFVMPDRFPQYSGETFQHITLADELDGSCAYLLEQGYDFGYSTFWHASVVTEKTDGQVRLAHILINPSEAYPLERSYWLTTEETMSHIDERPFLLLTREEEEFLGAVQDFEKVYEDEFFCIYDIPDPANVYNVLIR